ncbi:MAG: hypothetical protein HKN35_12665 [Woeseia sp.]|nr:hypothetical protein [Woeseia sp.]MBT8095810.1 hypothetical protein [Woeseia sp.]NNE61740.1 hypothetical protein [Woeseia sp.]NNL54153.1 hypothetical protein [Woeseia sp.]
MRAIAPGKVVLAGEYAVLHGAHAVAATVNRFARVVIETTDKPWIEVRAPGYCEESVRYRATEDGLLQAATSVPAKKNFSLFERAWRACAPLSLRGALITMDTSEFVDPVKRSKLGLGSSAALCVALTAAFTFKNDKISIAQLAGRIHQDFQGGGSGVDIACAVHGGVIDFCRDRGAPPKVALPDGLHLAVLWSGKPASTAASIKALSTSLQGAGRHATLHKLCAAADTLAGCWRSGNAAELFAQHRQYGEALSEFDADQKLGIYAGGHAEMAAAANNDGLFYKPCGAGGGDVGLAIALDAKKLQSFTELAPTLGFQPLELGFGVEGVRCTREDHGG